MLLKPHPLWSKETSSVWQFRHPTGPHYQGPAGQHLKHAEFNIFGIRFLESLCPGLDGIERRLGLTHCYGSSLPEQPGEVQAG